MSQPVRTNINEVYLLAFAHLAPYSSPSIIRADAWSPEPITAAMSASSARGRRLLISSLLSLCLCSWPVSYTHLGYPKDINVYQMQKTMENASCAVRKDGVVILLADCEEGSGSKVLEETFRRLKTPAAIKAELEANFKIGANKAYAITRPIEKARYILVTSLDRQLAKDSVFLTPICLLMGSTPTILPYTERYLGIILLGAPFMEKAIRCD